jgi:hypothetical protein
VATTAALPLAEPSSGWLPSAPTPSACGPSASVASRAKSPLASTLSLAASLDRPLAPSPRDFVDLAERDAV